MIQREGPITVRPVRRGRALRAEGGFFASGRGAGRAGRDFVTSPEVGPLFGACVARALDRLLARARASPIRSSWSRPAPGNGRLARDVLRAAPACAPRAALRARRAFGRAARRAARAARRSSRPTRRSARSRAVADDDAAGARVAASGPVFAALDELPALELERRSCSPTSCSTTSRSGSRSATGDGWSEVRVARDRPAASRRCSCPPSRRRATRSTRHRGLAVAPAPALPIPRGIDEWFARVRERAARTASCSSIDYVDDAPRMLGAARPVAAHLPRPRARRPIRSTRRATQDITADVVREQLARGAAPGFARRRPTVAGRVARATLGIDDLVDEGRRTWEARAARRRPRRARRPQPRSTEARRAHRSRRPRRAPRRRCSASAAPAVTVACRGLRDEPDAESWRTTLEHCCKRAAPSRRRPTSARTRSITDATRLRRRRARLAGLLGAAGARARLGPGVGHDPRVGAAVREVVRRRQAQRLVQLPRPSRRRRPRRPGRVPLGRRARRHAARSPTASCSTRRAASPTRCASLGVEKGDRVAIYMGMVPETRRRDARVRAHRRRRTRSCSAASPRSRCRTASTTPQAQGARHRRRRVAARRGRRAQGHRRRGARRHAVDRARARAAAHRERRRDASRPRRLVARRRAAARPAECASEAMDARTCSSSSTRRAPPGKPKGIMHTTGGYLTQVAYTHKYVFDLQARHRRLLVHRRRRLGHRPLVHRLRTAREPRDERDLRRHARLPRQGPAAGRSSRSTRSRSSTPRPPRSGRS